MSSKIIRDPLYNYISIDLHRDNWLISLIDSAEVQRLRRIHQLGVSSFTYPGAEHSRLSHSLGVLHLMQAAIDYLSSHYTDAQVRDARSRLLAAALLHDVGHGPYSHVFEPCLQIDHEHWSRQIILDEDSECHRALIAVDHSLPKRVADLIDPDNNEDPTWIKYLLSSQLDVDRLDYLRRDSFFSGAGYGHYDWYRILTSFELEGTTSTDRMIVWQKKSIMALEEYVFARYYMYQNVYLHKTTRGFEKMLEAMWRHGKGQFDAGDKKHIIPTIAKFWRTKKPTPAQYMRIEEYTVLSQIQNWMSHSDKSLADLSRRFLNRKPFAMIELPLSLQTTVDGMDRSSRLNEWDIALGEMVTKNGFEPVQLYCLRDEVKPKYHQPYFPEKEGDEQSAKNAIRVVDSNSGSTEISLLCPRLRPVTVPEAPQIRYYIPQEVRYQAIELRNKWRK